ncbi:MAG: MFS transporter [Gemmatimonadetes bacterium]|nr:MFS transporter [Gemmatimonadota bacterium]
MTDEEEVRRPLGDRGKSARSAPRPPLSRNVRILATVSFFTDVASEMIYPLLPLFLSTVLGTSAAALGVIEGLAESVSSLLRLPAGWYSDRIKRRKPFVVVGYSLASLVRPLIGLTQNMGQVLAIRLTDRFGKGLRSAPRDALIGDSVPPSQRGYAYGVHRAADSLGAVVGPLLAWSLLTLKWVDLRGLFLWAAVPGVVAVVLVVAFVKETGTAGPVRGAGAPSGATAATAATAAAPVLEQAAAPLGGYFWRYLAVLFVFTLSTSTDAFLLLRASQLGVATALIPILWALLHVVKSSSTVMGGALSDRVGRRPLILGGWALYALVYLGFAMASVEWHMWALFVVYGLYFGATEGTEKAFVADLVPAARRGTAFGWFNAALGLGALPASVVFGVVWERSGADAAFVMGAGIAALATLLFILLVPNRARGAV